MTTVAVLGASGFVGSAVVSAVQHRGVQVREVVTPRLSMVSSAGARQFLLASFTESDVVVNASGLPDATASSDEYLMQANSILPGIAAAAARQLNIRFIHISSAAVQGQSQTLDNSPSTAPFSSYSRSKAHGELSVLSAWNDAIIYRPPGVHDASRTTTQRVTRLATSRFSSVSGNGSSPSAQALLPNVADAVAFLALTDKQPPNIVHHPSEGITTGSLLRDLGGHEPWHLPPPIVHFAIRASYAMAFVYGGLAGHARRLDVLWQGQQQAPSWLTSAGWTPPIGTDGWRSLGATIRGQQGSAYA